MTIKFKLPGSNRIIELPSPVLKLGSDFRLAPGAEKKKNAGRLAQPQSTHWPYTRKDHLKPDDDAAHGWNWFDQVWYQNKSLPYPFGISSRTGVDLTDDPCDPSEGWELYIRRVLTTDGNPTGASVTEQVLETQKYFALYNTRTAVLRIFTHFATPAVAADRWILKQFCSMGAADGYLAWHAMFNHIGPIARAAILDRPPETNDLLTTALPITAGWIVNDIPCAFDPITWSSAVYLNTLVMAENFQDVSLEGNFSIKLPMDNDVPSAVGLVMKVGSAATSVGANSKNAARSGAKLSELGQRWNQAGGDGALLIAAGGMLSGWATGGAVAVAATQIVRSIISFVSGGGSTHYSTYEGTIRLKGQIHDTTPRAYHAICIQESPDGDVVTNPIDVPYIFKKYPKMRLGIFALDRPPKVSFNVLKGATGINTGSGAGGDFAYRLTVTVEEDLRDFLLINPRAQSFFGAEAEILGMQIVVTRPNMGDLARLGSGIAKETNPATKLVSIFPSAWWPSNYTGSATFVRGSFHMPSDYDDISLALGIDDSVPFHQAFVRVRYRTYNRYQNLPDGQGDSTAVLTYPIYLIRGQNVHMTSDVAFDPNS